MSEILGFMVAALIVFTPILIFILSVRGDRDRYEGRNVERRPAYDRIETGPNVPPVTHYFDRPERDDVSLREWP